VIQIICATRRQTRRECAGSVGPAGQPGTSIVLEPPAADCVTDDERRTIAEMMAKGSYATPDGNVLGLLQDR
jgi:hypothetical protein